MAPISPQMTHDEITTLCRAQALDVFGTLGPQPDDPVAAGSRAILLLGPHEPGFWSTFTDSAEYRDGQANPMDRWSKRVIGALAADLGGQALFPSDGPPYPPFIRWALASGRAWQSPVGMLVHDRAGLMVSYRGAIALPFDITAPPPALNPCTECPRPCLTACPVDALTGAGYDLNRCHEYLDSPAGGNCMSMGCAARRACPLSQTYGRLAEQSAFHMRHFHRE